MLVIHLVRAATGPLDITMVEPAAELGRGIAYSTADPAQRISVPTDRMALSRDDPGEATRWFFDHGILPDAGSADGQGHFYVPRRTCGASVADVLRRTPRNAGDRVRFTHRRAAARAVEPDGAGWRVAAGGRDAVAADAVALCFGQAVPHLPCPVPPEVRGSGRVVPDPRAPDASAGLGPDGAVLVVRTGLTMADVVAGLRARHRPPRRGGRGDPAGGRRRVPGPRLQPHRTGPSGVDAAGPVKEATMIKAVMVAVGLVALAGPALARAPHHHRVHHRRAAREVGFPIVQSASDVRINAVGEVIAPKIGKISVDGKVEGGSSRTVDPAKTR